MLELIGDKDTGRNPLFPPGTKCCVHGEIIIGKGYKYPNSENWDGLSFACNICYQNKYRIDNPDVTKKNSEKLSYMTNWKNGELDPYSERGRGYIIEQFVCKTLDIKNRNIEENTFQAKCDTTKHEKYGDIQIKGRTFNGHEWMTNIRIGEKFDTLIFACMDRHIPWKNVRRMYVIPFLELIGETNIHIYKNWSKIKNGGSKFERLEKYRIDEKLFNESYHNLTIEDCPALIRYKFEEWIRLMKVI